MAFRISAKKKIGGKFLVYGFTGEGKSYFGLTMPNIGAIDSETGLSFYESEDIEINGKKYNNLKFVDTTSNLDDLEENMDSVIEGEVDIETLLIDSETKLYISMCIGAEEAEERKAKLTGKNVDTRAKWGRVKNISMKMQQAKLTASAKGIHIVSTAQAKAIKEEIAGKEVIVGYKPDVHGQLPFDYDTILRFYTETDKKTKEIKYFAEVIKDRTHVTKVGQIIENCTYDIWKDYFDQRNGLKTNNANFSKDLKNSIDSVLNNAELSTQLADELKKYIKECSDKRAIKEKLDELSIDIKSMDTSEPKVLQQAIDFIKTLS